MISFWGPDDKWNSRFVIEWEFGNYSFTFGLFPRFSKWRVGRWCGTYEIAVGPFFEIIWSEADEFEEYGKELNKYVEQLQALPPEKVRVDLPPDQMAAFNRMSLPDDLDKPNEY